MSAAEPHAITRARECYGLELTMADLAQIGAKIRCRLTVLCRRRDTAEVHMVRHAGTVLLAVWIPKDHVIASFLARRRPRRPKTRRPHYAREAAPCA